MKKLFLQRITGLSLIFVSLLFFSCPSPGPGNTVNLTQIDLFLYMNGATGTFTIQLRDASGSLPALWSETVNADTLLAGSNWNSFTVPDVTLTKSQTYRIYATRSGTNAGGNQITWQSSDSVVDEYPQGVSSSPNPELDFTFRTYNDGVLDQSMETLEYGYSLSDSNFYWQEFVPES